MSKGKAKHFTPRAVLNNVKHNYFILMRQDITKLEYEQLQQLKLELLQKLAIVCDTLGTLTESWVNIPGVENDFEFSIKPRA